MPDTKLRVTVTVDIPLMARIDKLAAAVGQSRSAWIEARLRDAIEDEETSVKALTDPVVGPALLNMFKDRDVLRGLARVVQEELQPEQLRLFADRVAKLAGEKPRAAKGHPGKQWPPRGRRGRR